VHHRTIQINHQPDATIFQFIILMFIYSSTCFRRYITSYITGPTANTARLSPQYEGKTRGCHCSHWALDDGRENARTCWAVNRRQDNKLKNCCIWLVIYLNHSCIQLGVLRHPITVHSETLEITWTRFFWPNLVTKEVLIQRSNLMQQYADIYLPQSHSTCFGRHGTHHQEH